VFNLIRPSFRTVAVAAAIAIALWATALILVNASDGPTAVAEQYLTALGEADAEAAEELIAAEARRDGPLLNDEALTTGWKVASVEVVSQREGGGAGEGHWQVWTVAYSFEYGDRTASGELRLSDREGEIRVATPYVLASVSTGWDFIELNGLTHRLDDDQVEMLLYPGPYHLFDSHPDIADPARALVTAASTGEPISFSLDHDVFAISGELQARFDNEVREWLDECVSRDEAAAAGCPFGAEDDLGGEIRVGSTTYDEVTGLAWEVGTEPVILLRADWGGLKAVTRVEGTVIVTGEGTPRYAVEEGRTTFEVRCSMATGIEVAYTEAGDLEIETGPGHSQTC
jgi:hypothetical protein